ncbi:hypothetical protein W97_05327 [Coniosporium apollinis CBS 100218]|uniref:STEEP1 domain-containing protein n=1 Tax=Coniosporium apollinis (strain CBS 100218) TaxID=1168221 RepID=R7YWC8_CONA1|nr:uncharacterized protein W97_05327 [Coniosporium apollinis CBS 100218]EON66084.1 hypothetical protein W97_05327 [Coniosporium apollinis CBS 100218]
MRTTSPRIHTYHCLCTHLLLASTHPLSSLPRRGQSSLDKAYILALPPPPRHESPIADAESSDEDGEDDGNKNDAGLGGPSATTLRSPAANNYALLLSTVLDRKPVVVTRADGFEKRYLQRCRRCRLVVGYQLDQAQFADAPVATVGMESGLGRREDVIYLLPGGLLSTEDMAAGKTTSGDDVGFGLGG